MLNNSEWTNENTLELCPFFLILMRKCFALFCLFVFCRLLPTQNLPKTSADLYTTPQKERKKTPKRKTETSQ